MPRTRNVIGTATAAAALGATLAAAAALHAGLTLSYDQSGNGCRTLIGASAHDLAWAMAPVRVLVAAWVLWTGFALWSRVVKAGDLGADAQVGGWFATAVLAGWLQVFIATDWLSAFAPLVALWLAVLAAAVVAAGFAVARRSRPAAGRLWPVGGWLLLTGAALPVGLLALTGNGEILSC
jgi:hypothetical protein